MSYTTILKLVMVRPGNSSQIWVMSSNHDDHVFCGGMAWVMAGSEDARTQLHDANAVMTRIFLAIGLTDLQVWI